MNHRPSRSPASPLPGRFFLWFAASISWTLLGCTSRHQAEADKEYFTDVTAAVTRTTEVPLKWPDGRYQAHEMSGTGLALLDYDVDGDLDIYQVCAPPPDRPQDPAPNRLYQQQTDGSFLEVPGASGLADGGYGYGVAIGDVEGDGDADVFVANLHADTLCLNGGGGNFSAAGNEVGILGDHWSSSAAFFDYDRDGDLDLYVSRYAIDNPALSCKRGIAAKRDYCGPQSYLAAQDALYRNQGDGTFVDASRVSGIHHLRRGLGVVCVDFTGDGWVDIFVANDMDANLLYVNQGDGTFVDEALARGVAVDGAGAAEASMGVALGDVNGDGRFDLFMTHLVDQTNTLYVTDAGPGQFADRSTSSGLGRPSLQLTGWGCGFVDFDHDGTLDLAVVNGRVARGPVLPGADVGNFWNDYAEPNQLFLKQEDGRFADRSSQGGDFTARVEVSRALAFGDLDRDGDVDLVMTNLDNSLRVFRNDAPKRGQHWLQVRAKTGKRDALGALITIEAGGIRQMRWLITSYSYQVANEPVVHFGLGAATKIDFIEILWPDGSRERFPPAGVDQVVILRQGEGTTRT
jgi:hypothetical protein